MNSASPGTPEGTYEKGAFILSYQLNVYNMDVIGLFAANAAEIKASLVPCTEMALNSREYFDQRFAHVDATLARLETLCAARLDLELAQNRLEAAVIASAARLEELQRLLGQRKSDAAVQCDLSPACQHQASKRAKQC